MNAFRFLGLSPFLFAASVSAQTMDHSGHQGQDMSGMAMPTQSDPHPGHAMPTPIEPPNGQDMPNMAMPAAVPAEPAGPAGTDLEPGNLPPPPVATDRPADRYFDPRAMAAAQANLLGEHGGMTFHKVLFNIAEYQAREARDGYRWDASAWFGGDIDRLALKSEGEGSFGEAIDHGEVQALWSHAIDPYWNVQGGIRQDVGRGPDRTYASIGIEGLAPYWFDLGASAFVSTRGDLLARVEGDIDQRITQRLILQPRVEANFAAQDIPENGIGAGLSTLELGLRLRYEVAREFAPYIGVSWDRSFGDTKRMARAAGEQASSTSLVAGIRFWF
ncbi:copper resistance protein B [Edaphosphingomonas haloaromaticamans]|uniref:Copper resistance protein B n=3 Tax=Sphingomonadales TaxID=204457 RepID=A0A1S1HIW9_9SPHN|nr:copper resistance protein B [Sphingomonas haloaromaticamans]OHT21792.1 Copper resistance protein B precursor [Sphingomonas haloaromaticamans]